MNPDPLSGNARPSRAGSLALGALLLFAGMALAAPTAAAHHCNDQAPAQRVPCMVLEEPGCATTNNGRTACVVFSCEGTASVGTLSSDEASGDTRNCFHSTAECPVAQWREREGSGRTSSCLVDDELPPGPYVESCTGTDYGLIVLGTEVCHTPPEAGPCPTGYGVVVDGDSYCHTVEPCTSNPYGVAVDGSGCRTLSPCGPGETGYKVDGNDAACIGEPPSVALCSTGYGVEVGSSDHCVTVCPTGSYGVSATGCHTVAACPAGTLGYRVDGNGATCVADPTSPCPNGRKGVVVAGHEVCPVP